MSPRSNTHLALTLFGWFLLSACQLGANASPVLPGSTNTPADFSTLLFTAEDLGWLEDSYDMRPGDDLNPFESEPIAVIVAGATARSNPINPKTGLRYRDDPLMASQILFVYREKLDALRIFDEYELRGQPIGSYQPAGIRLISKVDNASWTCWKSGGSQATNCVASFQHGRYLTTAGLPLMMR